MGRLQRGQVTCNVSRNELTITSNVAERCLGGVRDKGVGPSGRLLRALRGRLTEFGPRMPLAVLFSCIGVHFPALSVRRVVGSVLGLGVGCVLRRSCKRCDCARRCSLKSVFVCASTSRRGNILLRLGKHNYERFRDCLLTRRED